MTRTEHLAWAKARAITHIDQGKLQDAYVSFLSDLARHPENRGRYTSEIMGAGLVFAASDRADDLRKWIEDFDTTLCHCGKPLHYSDPGVQAFVQRMVDTLGPDIRTTVGGRTWLVPRHYLALHGIKGSEISQLGFTEVTNV